MKSKVALSAFALVLSSQLHAANAPPATEGAILEEVVITAQKRTEKLSDVPVAASVVSSDVLDRNNITDISDLNNVVPSVNLNGTFNGRVPMGIRGVSTVSNEFTVGLTSGVATMIDGVPVPSDSYAANALEDVSSIEVLKGPQSTLGGRTAASGVINIVTRKPTDQLSGSISGTITSDSEYRLSGFVSGPISDTVKYSLSAYGNDTKWPVKNLLRNQKTDVKVSGFRGKLLFQPTSDLDITLTARAGKSSSSGFNFVYTYLTPGAFLLGAAFPGSPLAATSLLSGLTIDRNNLSYSSPVNAFSDVEDKDVSLNIDYRFGDMSFGSTTAYQHETQTNVQDLFAVNAFFFNILTGATSATGFPPTFGNLQTQLNDVKQVSQEFKLASSTDRAFSYLLGAFYSDSKVDEKTDRHLLGAFYNVNVTPDSKTYDLYARTTWKIQPTTSLVTGLRYNNDKISYNYIENLYTAFLPPPGDNSRFPVIVGSADPSNGIAFPPFPHFPIMTSKGSTTSSNVVGDISLQQKYGGSSMAYATYARGYSPVAYNTTEYLTPASPFTTLKDHLTPVKAEFIDHIEIGSKGTYYDRRLSVNAAAFYTKYKDFQVQVFDQSAGGINPPLVLQSAGAETKGLEVDLDMAATNTLRLNFSAAYIDAKFTDYKGAPCYSGQSAATCKYGAADPFTGTALSGTQDITGKTMPNAPKLKFNLGAQQRFPLSSLDSDLVVGGTYAHRGSAQMLANQNPQTIQNGFGLLNLNAGVESHNGKLALMLFANNVFDKHYYVDLEDFWSSPWTGPGFGGNFINAVVGQPARDTKRYFGARFTAKF